ncbi:hypothetical protein AX16_000405 [Volvariella volvacea WC 439]|nr:hypothetical protein AX16_000405 [Volvariella volvacea WC 439]
MNDAPYTTPDEDPFGIQPVFSHSHRRPTSLLSRWIEEQHEHRVPFDRTSLPSCFSSRSTSYVLSHPTSSHVSVQDAVHLHPNDNASLMGYDLVDDLDIPPPIREDSTATVTSRRRRTSWRTSKFMQTQQSLRNLTFGFRSSSVSPATLQASRKTANAPNRSSLPPIPSPPSTPNSKHERSSSLGSFKAPTRSSSRWRPSVLHHFSPSLERQESSSSVLPCSSTSSDKSKASHAHTADVEIYSVPKPSWMDTIRARRKPRHSLTQPGNAPAVRPENIPPDQLPQPSPNIITQILSPSPFQRRPLMPKQNAQSNTIGERAEGSWETDEHAMLKSHPTRPQVAYSSTLGRRVSFSSLTSRKKKRKLVISGIKHNDNNRFEAVKRWCEVHQLLLLRSCA